MLLRSYAIITTLAVQFSFIILTELTIAKEGDWTFGQTLALKLTLIPLIEVVKFLWEKCSRAPKESGECTEASESGPAVETGEMASWYLVSQWGQGHILEMIGFGGTLEILSDDDFTFINFYPRFFTYLAELLENPRRTGTHVFYQQRYATAAKECLQLCLCSHNTFLKVGVTDFSRRDM